MSIKAAIGLTGRELAAAVVVGGGLACVAYYLLRRYETRHQRRARSSAEQVLNVGEPALTAIQPIGVDPELVQMPRVRY